MRQRCNAAVNNRFGQNHIAAVCICILKINIRHPDRFNRALSPLEIKCQSKFCFFGTKRGPQSIPRRTSTNMKRVEFWRPTFVIFNKKRSSSISLLISSSSYFCFIFLKWGKSYKPYEIPREDCQRESRWRECCPSISLYNRVSGSMDKELVHLETIESQAAWIKS